MFVRGVWQPAGGLVRIRPYKDGGQYHLYDQPTMNHLAVRSIWLGCVEDESDESDDRDRPSPARPTSTRDTSLGGEAGVLAPAGALDKVKPLDPAMLGIKPRPGGATMIDELTSNPAMRDASSGVAATISAMSRLPEKGQLELESKRLKYEFQRDLVDAMARDRSEERSAATTRSESQRSQEQRTETLSFLYLLVVTVPLIGLVIGLFINGQGQAATPILTTAVGLGAGWLGGRGSGYAKAQRDQQPQKPQQGPP